jgi:hypothetical protein
MALNPQTYRRNYRYKLCAVIVASFFAASAIAASQGAATDTQINALNGATTKAMFELERHEGASPDKLTASLKRQLLKDADVMRCVAQTGAGAKQIKRDWFVVYRMDLNSDGRDDWIIKSRAACMMGANVGAWWVYLDGAKSQQLLLKTNALALEILQTTSHGFDDLLTHRVTGEGKDLTELFQVSSARKAYLTAKSSR